MERKVRLIDGPVLNVTDKELLSLFTELEFATQIVRREERMSVWTFLVQCHYPFGSEPWMPIGKDRVIPGGLLSRKIGKLEATSGIVTLCEEIAQISGLSIEAVSGMTLYVFLDRYLPNFEKKKKRPPFDPRKWM
jgi:hypothetical protein